MQINPAKTAISRAVALQPKLIPSILDDVVADHIKASISISGLNLHTDTFVPNDIGLKQAKVAFNIHIIAGQRTGAVTHDDKIRLQFAVSAAAGGHEVSKEPPSISRMVRPLTHGRSAFIR